MKETNTPRTDELVEYIERLTYSPADRAYVPTNYAMVSADFARQLETELAEAKAKLKYVDSIGIQIGVMKTTDCPEGMLAHIYRKGCTFDRVLKEWSHSIGWEEKLAESQARERELIKERDEARDYAEQLMQLAEWVECEPWVLPWEKP